MKLSACVACKLPVLELDGQFAKLDSFYIRDGEPPEESAGEWHLSCLQASPFGSAWHDARLRNFCEVRGFERVAETIAWTVLRDPRGRSTIAIGRSGEILELSIPGRKHARAVAGGSVYPRIEHEFHLELDDADTIKAIKSSLQSTTVYALPRLLADMSIADRVVHPEALEDGVLRFDPDLQQFWQKFSVSARCEYGVFIPDELEPHAGERVR